MNFRPPPTAIVTAAGASRRMGQPKLLLPFGESTVLESTVESLLNGGIREILLVFGPQAPFAALAANHAEWTGRVRGIPNSDRGSEMLDSIQLALAEVPEGRDFLVMPGDQPGIRADTIALLLEQFGRLRPQVLQPECGGQRGHPVLLREDLRQRVLALQPPQTLRDVVRASERTVVLVTDSAVVLDIDTPADYRARRPDPSV